MKQYHEILGSDLPIYTIKPENTLLKQEVTDLLKAQICGYLEHKHNDETVYIELYQRN